MQQSKGFKSLLVLYYSMLAAQLVFLFLALYMVKQDMFQKELAGIENILLLLLLLLTMICTFSGNKMYKSRLQKLVQFTSLNERFAEYRAANIIRWALMEGACLFAIICFMLTSNYLFLLIALLVLLYFGSMFPFKAKAADDMSISEQEIDSID